VASLAPFRCIKCAIFSSTMRGCSRPLGQSVPALAASSRRSRALLDSPRKTCTPCDGTLDAQGIPVQRARSHRLAWLVCSLAACSENHTDAPRDPNTPYLNALQSAEDLAFLAGTTDVAGVKYLTKTHGAAPVEPLTADCYFQNMRVYPWHLQFLQSFPEQRGLSFDAYRNLVLRGATRRLWGGALQRWPEVPHPASSAPGVISYSIYADPGGLSVDAVVEVDRRLKGCAPFAQTQLVFVPEQPDQESFLTRERAALANQGVFSLFASDLLGDLTHVAYAEGENYGWLNIVPAGQELSDYGPLDVVIVDSAPVDISIVAGLITKTPQNELGHVNLRLREKGIPNAAVPSVYESASIADLDTKLVHYQVSADGISIEAATLGDAQTFWDLHRPQVRMPSADFTVDQVMPLNQLRATDAKAYGAKCANLGELTQVIEPPHRPDGFGIPFLYYRDFMREQGLDAELEALLASGDLATDRALKRSLLKQLRDRIKQAPLNPALFEKLRAAVEAGFGAAGATTTMRFRSSTNVEDLDQLTGAGLYDSRSGCLADDLDGDELGPSACLTADKRADLERQLTERKAEQIAHPERGYLQAIIEDIEEDLREEKPLSGALRKVWASLWNERAFDEREYYRIDHRLAFMGLAVHPSYALERANAVAVSNLKVDDGAPLYRINSQLGELSVVRPEDPMAVAEVLTFRREHEPPEATQIRLDLGSSLLPAGSEVWPRPKLLELAQLLFRVHDHFAQHVYPALSPLALDFEVKLEQSEVVSIKQVRPYLSTDP
jgi:pyruvate,water dikinase